MAEGGMIERVAKALCKHCEPDCWKTHTDDARAAIEAMREPSIPMVEAAVAHSFACGFDRPGAMVADDLGCPDDAP